MTAPMSTQVVTPGGYGLGDLLPLTDTVGRTITYSKTSNTQTITILANDGLSKTYVVRHTNCTVGIPSPGSGTATIQLVSSID